MTDKADRMPRRTFLQLAGAGAAAVAAGETMAQTQTQPAAPASEGAPRTAANALYGCDKLYDAKEPYILLPGPHLFIDWRYVHPGVIGYKHPDGKPIHYFGDRDPKGTTSTPWTMPYGIKLVAQKADKIGPLFPNDRDWEYCIYSYISLFDLGGKFGMWYEVVPPGEIGRNDVYASHQDLLCYAESTDGMHWTRPELNLVEYNGSKKNNIVFHGQQCYHKTAHGMNVFIDPSAPPNERFKAVFMAFPKDEAVFEKIQRERPWSCSRYGIRKHAVIQFGTSPDGFHWTFNDKIALNEMSDTQTIVHYDEVLKRYVGYFRTRAMGRRAIGRAETEDLYSWPVPDVVLCVDNDQECSADLYNNSKVLYPGTKDMHLMFPTIYHHRTDSTTLGMASSMDGLTYRWVPGGDNGDVLTPGPDSWDAECVFGGCGLVEIPGDRVVLPYAGYEFAHKYPRWPRAGHVGLASWKKERLCALQADEEGEFWTLSSLLPGQTLYLNYETKQAGYIKVEVVDIEGRKLEDCDPLTGNKIKAPVSWHGEMALRVPEGKAATFHFRMRAAKLYSFEVK